MSVSISELGEVDSRKHQPHSLFHYQKIDTGGGGGGDMSSVFMAAFGIFCYFILLL